MLDILLPFTLLLVIYNMYLFFYEIIKKCNNKKDIIYSSFFASLICFIIMLALQNYLYDNLSPINTPVMTLIYGGMEESFKIWSIFRIKIHKKINDSYTAMAYFMITGLVMMLFELFTKFLFLIQTNGSIIDFFVIFWTVLNHILWPGITGYFFGQYRLLTGLLIAISLHGLLNNYIISTLKLYNVDSNIQIFAIIFSLVTTTFIFLKCAKKAKLEYDLSTVK